MKKQTYKQYRAERGDHVFTFEFPKGTDSHGDNYDHCKFNLRDDVFIHKGIATKSEYDPKWLAIDTVPVIRDGEVIYEESIFQRSKSQYA